MCKISAFLRMGQMVLATRHLGDWLTVLKRRAPMVGPIYWTFDFSFLGSGADTVGNGQGGKRGTCLLIGYLEELYLALVCFPKKIWKKKKSTKAQLEITV